MSRNTKPNFQFASSQTVEENEVVFFGTVTVTDETRKMIQEFLSKVHFFGGYSNDYYTWQFLDTKSNFVIVPVKFSSKIDLNRKLLLSLIVEGRKRNCGNRNKGLLLLKEVRNNKMENERLLNLVSYHIDGKFHHIFKIVKITHNDISKFFKKHEIRELITEKILSDQNYYLSKNSLIVYLSFL